MTRVEDQYRRACGSLAGGVSSSTRLNRAVGHACSSTAPPAAGCGTSTAASISTCAAAMAQRCWATAMPRVRRAVEAALDRGAACSYENEQHAELAELLCETVPCLERVRFTGSGTEATMHCLRLARAFTGRPKLLKFEGNFHGYHDQVMFAIGTPADRLGPEEAPARYPGSTGLPPGLERPRPGGAVQPARLARSCFRPARLGDRCGHRRADLLQRRLHPADAASSSTRCRRCRASTASCSSSTRC